MQTIAVRQKTHAHAYKTEAAIIYLDILLIFSADWKHSDGNGGLERTSWFYANFGMVFCNRGLRRLRQLLHLHGIRRVMHEQKPNYGPA